jgi:hypothetical protein
MPQTSKAKKPIRIARREKERRGGSTYARYTVGLDQTLAGQVESYAKSTNNSMSKAIATLVQAGISGQEQRRRDFFQKLKANLSSADPSREDELIDEFRSLILGR